MDKILTKVAYKKRAWGYIDAKPFCYENENRPAVSLAIGHSEDINGKKEYIVEDMYIDIMGAIYDESKGYTTYVNVWVEPHVVIMKDGFLCEHNADILEYIKCIREEIKVMDIDTLVSCLLELKLTAKNQRQQGPNTKAFMKHLKNKYQIPFNIKLVECVLNEYLYTKSRKYSIPELASLDYATLLSLSNDIVSRELSATKVSELYCQLENKYENIKEHILREINIRQYYDIF